MSESDVPLGWIVTRLAWIAAKLVSSTVETEYARSEPPRSDYNYTERLTQGDQVGLGSLLQSSDSRGLETQVGLEVLSDLTNQTLEGELSDKELSRFLNTGRKKG